VEERKEKPMKVNKAIQKRIRHSGKGKNVVGDVNAAVTANSNESASGSRVVSRQRIVQRDGETVEETAHTSREEIPGGGE
jgi:hypothetical protein